MKCNIEPCSINDKPFIFISYAHSDAQYVFPVLEGVGANGYNIWYDYGIEITTAWSDEIANAILASDIAVVFISRASMASNYVRSEVEFALSKKISVVPIYLEGLDVLPPGLALALHSTQGIHSNDPGTIISKLCKWLSQSMGKENKTDAFNSVTLSFPSAAGRRGREVVLTAIDYDEDKPKDPEPSGGGEEIWQPVKSSMTAQKQPSSANRRQEIESTDWDTDEGGDNYWHSGLYGNKDEYEKYLRIQDMLAGRPSSGAAALRWVPLMMKLLSLIFFLNVTEILNTYSVWGVYQRPFTSALLTFGLPPVLFYWYFHRCRTLRNSFLGSLLPGKPLSSLYLLFLLSWLLYALDFERLKVWLPYGDQLLQLVRVNVDLTPYMLADLPRIPAAVKTLTSFIVKAGGLVWVIDAIATAVTSFFSKK